MENEWSYATRPQGAGEEIPAVIPSFTCCNSAGAPEKQTYIHTHTPEHMRLAYQSRLLVYTLLNIYVLWWTNH